MNIHFTDELLFENLSYNTIAKTIVGSHMYGLDNEKSDVDYLYIYLNNQSNNNSIMWEHHQLQYKKNDIDYNFTTLQSFIRNALTGDATINFEVIYSGDLKNTYLEWLIEYKDYFINYNIIKSYLGMAKRDLKNYLKITNNLKNHTTETNKKLSHFVRGVYFAHTLFNGIFELKKNDIEFELENKNFNFNLKDIKNGKNIDYSLIIEIFEKLMINTRIELNKTLDAGKIVKFMEPKKLKEIDEKIKNSYSELGDKVKEIDYGDIFYEALEEGINY